jgi:hypothetical protein
MALSAAEKTRVKEIYYLDAKGRRNLSDAEIVAELMGIVLNNPSAAQKTQITNFLNARKAASEATEAAAPVISAATVAAEDTLQAELTTLVGNL